MSTKPTTIPPKVLSQAILAAGTTFVISNIEGWDGADLTSASFGTVAFGAFMSPDRRLLELFSFDPSTIASASITFVDRGLAFTGENTVVTANKLDWPAGTIVMLGTDTPQFMTLLAALGNTNAFTGANSFTLSPTVPTPSSATDAANKAYVDNGFLQGGADASTTVKGIGRLATSPNGPSTALTSISNASPAVLTLVSHGLTAGDSLQLTTSGTLPTGLSLSTTYYVISAGLTANAFQVSATFGGSAINTSSAGSGTHSFTKTTPVFVGTNDPRLQENNYVPNSYAASSAGTDTYAITLNDAPSAYATGQVFYFKADVANTGACTLNVNSLGAKSLKMNTGLDPVDGYIKAGALVEVQYDGTNLQILSVSGKPSVSQTGEEVYAATATGNDTYVITLNPVPTAYTNGMTLRFKADVANTGAATLNVNGLGAISLVTGVSTAVATGDILANQIIEVLYNSTGPVFQIINPIPQATLYTMGTFNKDMSTTTTTTIAHGLARAPTRINISWFYANTSNMAVVTGQGYFYNTQGCAFIIHTTNGSVNGVNSDASYAVHYSYGGTSLDHNKNQGVISVDATNITITWTVTNSPTGVAYFSWSAEA